MPATLLRLDKSHQAAVFEAGTNHPGELAPLINMIQPKFGVITNIGREHLEFLVMSRVSPAEEGWLAELLPAEGKLFLNGDNEWTEQIVKRTRATVLRVGLGDKNDWHARKIRLDKNGVTFQVDAPQKEFNGEYRVNLLGRHQVTNALLAVAVGAELGLGAGEIQGGLASCQPPKMRLQFWEANGVRVLDDAYNANGGFDHRRAGNIMRSAISRTARGGARRHGRTRRLQRDGPRGSWPARGGIKDRPAVHGWKNVRIYGQGGAGCWTDPGD